MAKKHVYFYGAGKAEAKGEELSKSVLGGKGIGLMEMTSIGIPVPAGFTVTIQTCEEYYKLGRNLLKLQDSVADLSLQTFRKLFTELIIFFAGLYGDGETRRDMNADRGHFHKADALAA